MKKSFTLIEILVVATILGLLAAAGFITYTQLARQSRDAKRKLDLEQVRAALEIYRSNIGSYPFSSVPPSWSVDLNVLTAPVVYLKKLPQDPNPDLYSYYYYGSDIDYVLATHLENGSTNYCLIDYCSNCNYCVGPYGEIQ